MSTAPDHPQVRPAWMDDAIEHQRAEAHAAYHAAQLAYDAGGEHS